jgi:CheY-like chemotaxis protein
MRCQLQQTPQGGMNQATGTNMSEPDRKIQSILLVDDEPSVVFALKLLLQALGYQVEAFNTPSEAVIALESQAPFDLVLCDLKMPVLNGLGVLKACRAARPELPFVLMSAHASSEEIEQAYSLGATGFLPKPFTPEELKQLIEKLSKT